MKNRSYIKKFNFLKIGFMTLSMVLMTFAVYAFNVTVKTSAGVGIPSVTVSYNGDGGGSWSNTTTDVSGNATIPAGQNYVKVNYNLSSTGWVNTGGINTTFYTTAVTARVLNCNNAVVPGASFRFNPGATLAGTWLTGATQELLAGQWCIAADIYGHVRNVQTPTLPGTNTTAGLTLTVTFKTVKVTGGAGSVYCDPSSTGQYDYFRVGPYSPATGVELLPGSYYFKNNSSSAHYTSGTIVGPYNIGTGCTFILPHKVTVKTNAGVGIAGVTVSYNNCGGPCGTWLNTTTNASGEATIPGGQNWVRVLYNLSSTGWVNTGGADITFYTTAVTVQVVTCANVVLSGATFKFNPGTTAGGTWLTGSTNQIFVGDWFFRARYVGGMENGKTVLINGLNTTPGKTQTISFTTVLATGGSGTVYVDVSPTGPYNYFDRAPSFTPFTGIELLPGYYYFKINSTTSHYLNGTVIGPFNVGCQDFVVNGNFSAGNTGFTNGYGYDANAGGLADGGQGNGGGEYAITSNAMFNHSSFRGFDHTTGSGLFLCANGKISPVSPSVLWEQTVTVASNTNYYFVAWGANVDGPTSPVIQFRINGNPVSGNFTLPANTIGNMPTWVKYNTTWNSGATSGAVTISIYDLNSDAQGNDLGLDDISFCSLTACTFTIPSARLKSDITSETEFGVYPNPANNMITVNYASEYEGQAFIRVMDLTGKLIFIREIRSVIGANVQEVDLSNFSNGVYLMKFENDKNIRAIKIMVQH